MIDLKMLINGSSGVLMHICPSDKHNEHEIKQMVNATLLKIRSHYTEPLNIFLIPNCSQSVHAGLAAIAFKRSLGAVVTTFVLEKNAFSDAPARDRRLYLKLLENSDIVIRLFEGEEDTETELIPILLEDSYYSVILPDIELYDSKILFEVMKNTKCFVCSREDIRQKNSKSS